jgi:hypothetical protein
MSNEIAKDAGMIGVGGFPAIPPQVSQVALAQRFAHLAETWKMQTGHFSSITKKCTHPAYQRIIGLGPGVVPLILRDLKSSHYDWFWALSAITGDNPITEGDAGNVALMTEAWLRWGKAKGYDV